MCASTEIINAEMDSSIDLSTPTELHATIPNVLGASFADIHASFNSSALNELHAKRDFGLGVPIDHFNLSWNMSAPTEIIIDMTSNLLVDSSYDKPTDLCVPCAVFRSSIDMSVPTENFVSNDNHVLGTCVNDIPTMLSTPTIQVNSSISMSVQTEILAPDNAHCDLKDDYSMDHIKLVRNNEELAKISHANSLFSVVMDPPISLSHARNKIDELPCLKSVYAPDVTFNLVGEYVSNNVFMVHRICIMCDDSYSSNKTEFVYMLSHFDMTSNVGIHSMSNNLLQNCLIQHDVASKFETLHFGLPTLGWFNDEHYNLKGVNMCFTYICKLSCDKCLMGTNELLCYYNTSICTEFNGKHDRAVKTDDIYIYHAYTLSLLLACLQNKHRRGRLFFQEREDDEDMITSDLKAYLGEKDETTSRTTSIQVGEDDEDISMIDTTNTPTATFQVQSLLGILPDIYENMMLPKSNVFILFRNGSSMDAKHWIRNVHGDGSRPARIQDGVASEDFRTLKPP
jgi:hypothetical protein